MVVPCFDVAGVVMEVGTNCRRIKKGESVYGMAKFLGNRYMGAAAEFVAISERCLAKMPRNVSYLQAATFPMIALTTYQSLSRFSKDGTKILILGGSGGVGSFAIQYCKAKGCYVTTTCGERNVENVTQLGADRVLDYTKENWSQVLQGENFDVIFDCVGGEDNWVNSEKVLKPKGSFVTIVGDDVHSELTVTSALGLATSVIGRKLKSFFNSPQYYYVNVDSTKGSTQLIDIRNMIEGEFIKPVIQEQNVFNVQDIADAIELNKGGHVYGKVAVRVDADAEKNPDQMDLNVYIYE